MGKEVIVDGKPYDNVSTVALAMANGGTALFRDVDEASGGTVQGIVAMACGEFSVDAMTGEYTIQHGMTVAPDVICVIPKYWYDTQDNNFAILVSSRYASATGGRRAVDGNTSHFQGGISDDVKDWSTEIHLSTSSLAKFRATYITPDGETGTQVYQWVAVKFKESANA